MAEWYYSMDDEKCGPVSTTALRELVAQGKVCADHLVWKDGYEEWVPARRVKGLFDGAIVAAPAAAQPAVVLPTDAGRPAGPDIQAEATRAARDAWFAFRTLTTNPIGGLPQAYEALGERQAAIVGVIFALAFAACAGVSSSDLLSKIGLTLPASSGAAGVIAKATVGLIGLASIALGSLSCRKLFGGRNGVAADIFLAGTALLPFGACLLALYLLGSGNVLLVTAVLVTGACWAVLILYAGCTRLHAISETASTLAVPAIIVISLFVAQSLAKVVR